MAFRSAIQRGVDSAFSIIGDLGTTLTFTNTTSSTYDFGNGESTETSLPDATILGIVSNVKRNTVENSTTATISLKSNDATGLDVYDEVTFNSNTWKVISYSDNDYIVTVEVSRSI